MKEIYNASLVCLDPHLTSDMAVEFEKLKEEFKYVIKIFPSIMYLLYFSRREDDPKDEGVIVIEDDDDE